MERSIIWNCEKVKSKLTIFGKSEGCRKKRICHNTKKNVLEPCCIEQERFNIESKRF